jgi:hypothetical protein
MPLYRLHVHLYMHGDVLAGCKVTRLHPDSGPRTNFPRYSLEISTDRVAAHFYFSGASLLLLLGRFVLLNRTYARCLPQNDPALFCHPLNQAGIGLTYNLSKAATVVISKSS